MSIEIGAKYRFNCPPITVPYPSSYWEGYDKHTGHIVTVVDRVSAHVSDDPLFYIKAEDGWKGAAWAGELEPV